MPVKSYKWPFVVNPHTLMIQADGDKWSTSICSENAYVMIIPGNAPEFVRLLPDGKVHKTVLEEIDPTHPSNPQDYQ